MADRELWAGKLLVERQANDPLLTWEPFGPQRQFLQWPGEEAWYIGANRCGKSDALAACVASFARNGNLDPRPAYAGNGAYIYDRAVSIWAVSLTFDMAREIFQPKLFDNGEVPPGQHPPFIPNYELLGGSPEKAFNKNDKTLKLKNGSLITFKAAEQGQSRLQGTQKDLIAFDEAPPKLVYNECAIRRGAGRKLYIRGACTLLPPSGVVGGISWLYTDKIKPWLAGNRPKHLHLQGAKIYDNPHIPRDEIAILESLYAPGSVDREVRMNGAWLPQIIGDLAYGNFRHGLHVNPALGDRTMNPYEAPIPLRYNVPLFLCYDSNFSPATMLVVQQHGRIYRVYDEIVLESGTVGDVGRELVRRYPHHRAEALLFGDATAQRVSAQTAQSDYELLMEEFRRLPYPVTLQLPERQPPVRDRINAVNFLLRGPNGEVRVEVAPRCPELIEDLETVQRDRKGGILKAHDKKDPYFRRTHTSDSLGYMAVFREPVGSVEAIREGIATAGGPGFARLPSPGYAGLGR
jgi:phage terminase large subunit-like protein